MLEVRHNEIDRLRPIVATAIKCEKTLFQDAKQDKSDSWMLKMMKDADLEMDDAMKAELGERISKNRMKEIDAADEKESKGNEDAEPVFKKYDDDGSNKRRIKENQKTDSLNKKYEKEKEKEEAKRFSNSSFLTPESARYLNDLIKSKNGRVDKEMIYAGL